MLKKLTNNLGLKVLALFISCILWLVSININDPISQATFDTVVQITNVDEVKKSGKYIEPLDGTENVRVTVRATRSVLSKLDASNIKATADLSKINDSNMVPIEVSTSKTAEKVEKLSPDHEYVELDVENIKKVQLPISVNVLNEPAVDYVLGGTSTTQNAVIISGPESLVNTVKFASVDINVDGAVSDVNIVLPVKLYNENGDEVDSKKITSSIQEVSTTATILYTKKIPVLYSYIGEPQAGFETIGDIQTTVDEIVVSGKPNVLKNVNSIEIPDAVDITDAKKTTEARVDIRKYLPANVTLLDNKSGKAVVTVRIHRVEKEDEE